MKLLTPAKLSRAFSTTSSSRMFLVRSENFDDPGELAKLRAVSHAMKDAVAATGRKLKELHPLRAVRLGCFSSLARLLRGGILQHPEYLCHAAARSGQREKLKLYARTTHRGTRRCARKRRGAGTSRCCCGRAQTAVRGTQALARRRRREGTIMFWNGRKRTVHHPSCKRTHSKDRRRNDLN